MEKFFEANETPANRRWKEIQAQDARTHEVRDVREDKETERTVGISVSVVRCEGDRQGVAVALVEDSREAVAREQGEENIIFHEMVFGKHPKEYNSGEWAIVSIALTTPLTGHYGSGAALTRLVRQAFLLGMSYGADNERSKIQKVLEEISDESWDLLTTIPQARIIYTGFF